MFDFLLIHGILRHFVPQNDSVLFVRIDFVYTLRAADWPPLSLIMLVL